MGALLGTLMLRPLFQNKYLNQGAWKARLRYFVKTRTPKQIASRAHKYLNRQQVHIRGKLRRRVFMTLPSHRKVEEQLKIS